MYSNVRGIKGKKESLIEIINEYKPQMFVITETLLKSNTGTKIDGYTFYGKAREGKNGGGVGVLVRNDINETTAPHITERNIEIIWISVRRKKLPPLLIAAYYGKQESRTSKDEIEREMALLQEEIEEMKKEGELIIMMDGNAKLDILGEGVSRNGKLLMQVTEEAKLEIINKSEKCEGKVTRQNTKNLEEKSAIDFVMTTENAAKWIQKMSVDEKGMAKIKGKQASDHNTIILELKITNIDRSHVEKKTTWNLRAPGEKWKAFENNIGSKIEIARSMMENKNLTIDQRYKKWAKGVEESAWGSIGKTTFKLGVVEKFSIEVENLRKQKGPLKKQIQSQTDGIKKEELVNLYKTLQEEIRNLIIMERTEKIKQKFNRIIADKSRATFWKVKRESTKDPALESTVLKNENGVRVYSPDQIKYVTENYYRNLYKRKYIEVRPFHTDLQLRIEEYKYNREFENNLCNSPPTETEIAEIILGKKNGKSTTDFKNELIKRTGLPMVKYVTLLMETIWQEETIPEPWKMGLVTSLYKGKGDKEVLSNHRGITVSSAFGSIMEDIIDRRMSKTIQLTQAQGGGRVGASTCDHIFILRTIIKVSLHQKRKTFVTFFDVTKAFDNVDNNDMLGVMWEGGLRGKIWRILRDFSSNLKAEIKTRHGKTNEIEMEIGGKQGSKLTCRMFSKLMDVLSEIIMEKKMGIKLAEEVIIGALLWMDDVVTIVENESELIQILEIMDNFAKDHKLKWGLKKCNVMPIGNHTRKEEWKFGDEKIKKCSSYKYLGDIITKDGKNKENIAERKRKSVGNTISINTIAANEILNGIATPVLLELHEKITIPSLLNNAEAWDLLISDYRELEQIEISSLKYLFNLPTRTPTPGIIFALGTLYTEIRIHKKQLIFLHRILTRDVNHWTSQALKSLQVLNIGWYKEIINTLQKCELQQDFEEIKKIPEAAWKAQVTKATEKRNRQKLLDESHKKEGDMIVPKRKTQSIVRLLENTNYSRAPINEILSLSKNDCKTLIISRFGMLECGANYKGTSSGDCLICDRVDDEEHRLNHCVKYRDTNFYDEEEKTPFKNIYSDNCSVVRVILKKIQTVWNTHTGGGSMS